MKLVVNRQSASGGGENRKKNRPAGEEIYSKKSKDIWGAQVKGVGIHKTGPDGKGLES